MLGILPRIDHMPDLQVLDGDYHIRVQPWCRIARTGPAKASVGSCCQSLDVVVDSAAAVEVLEEVRHDKMESANPVRIFG